MGSMDHALPVPDSLAAFLPNERTSAGSLGKPLHP